MLSLQNILSSSTLNLKKGDRVFKQGESVNSIYYITQGRVKLVRNTVEGTPIVIHVAYAGEGIAEASLFSDEYHCSALVDANTKIAAFSKVELLKYLQNNPNSMMDLLKQLTYQVRDLRMLNEIKSIYSAEDKVLTYLATKGSKDFDSRLSLKDIAQKIGMAHETFYRTLKVLENKGEISRDGNQIKLIN